MKDTFGIDDAVIPIYYPSSLVRWLESKGYKRLELIENTGLEPEGIDAPEVLVTYGQHRVLISNALRLTQNPHLGLYFGQQLQLTSMGMVGFAAISSDNLLQSLQTIVKYIKLRAPLIKMSMKKVADNIHITYSEALDYGPIRLFMYEAILSGARVMYSMIEEADDVHTQVNIPIEQPNDWDQHQSALPFLVQFNQPQFEFVIPVKYLQQKSKLADPVTANSAKKICDEELKKVEAQEGLISRINHIINEDCSFPSLSITAQTLCVSSRTLRRELQKLDTTYQTLLDQARQKIAIKLLKNSVLSIQEIAIQMGYTDPANFGRAFRKWTGKSPGFYRH